MGRLWREHCPKPCTVQVPRFSDMLMNQQVVRAIPDFCNPCVPRREAPGLLSRAGTGKRVTYTSAVVSSRCFQFISEILGATAPHQRGVTNMRLLTSVAPDAKSCSALRVFWLL